MGKSTVVVFSPLLWFLVGNDLMVLLNINGVVAQGFADDNGQREI